MNPDFCTCRHRSSPEKLRAKRRCQKSKTCRTSTKYHQHINNCNISTKFNKKINKYQRYQRYQRWCDIMIWSWSCWRWGMTKHVEAFVCSLDLQIHATRIYEHSVVTIDLWWKNNEFLMNFMSFDSVVECSEWFMMSLCHRRAGEPMRRRQEHSFQIWVWINTY